jgi:predicted DNA-binding transcriptional regulator AlpA
MELLDVRAVAKMLARLCDCPEAGRPATLTAPFEELADLLARLRDRPEAGRPASSTAAIEGLLDVQALAGLLGCSGRSVYRLADAGKIPAPLKLGALVRWRPGDIAAWIDGGCKPVRTTAKGGKK